MTSDQRGVLIGALIAIGIFLYVTVVVPKPPSAIPASNSLMQNLTNDRLLRETASEQAKMLSAGAGCNGTSAFYMGLDSRKVGFWTLRCTDGRNYLISILPDFSGTIRATECELVRGLKTGIRCFAKLHPALAD